MIITISWLKEHLNTKVNESEIINHLTNIGLEVEGIKENSGEMSAFKVARIIKTEKHPNADKLKVCDVSLGGSEILKVVCGAPNAREGLVTIYAPPGAVIPKTKFELKVAKIRGIESRGMLCSESELNLSNESDGIIELKNKEKNIGKSYFNTKSEKSIDISITPNRPDCLGIRGIARDLSSAGVGKLIQTKIKKIKLNESFMKNNKIDSFKSALACDPVSAFGGIVSCNYKITKDIAIELNKIFLEVIVGNGFDQNALKILKKNLSLIISKYE